MKAIWCIVAVAIGAWLVGCGGGDQTGATSATSGAEAHQTGSAKKVSQSAEKARTLFVSMDGWEGAETVSVLMAEQRGYFAKAGLSVTTLSPVSPTATIPYVVDRQEQIGIAHGPEAVAARDKGVPIVIVGNVLQQATASFIWKKGSGILGIADLKGKTIAIPGLSFQKSFLQNVLTEGGLEEADVKVISVGNELVPALVSGRADAIFGGSANLEGVDLESRGYQPVVTPVTDLGIPDYDELVLVARRDVAEAEPELMDDFVSAVARGAYAATDQPDEAAEALEAAGERNPEIRPSAMQVQVAATVGKLSDSGYVDPARFQRLINWMFENEMIRQAYPVAALLPKP